MTDSNIPKEIYIDGNCGIIFDAPYKASIYWKRKSDEKYIHESEVKQLEKKARCWDKLKKETEDSIWMEEVGYIGVIQEIEQEVEADET